jgi:hypothetical protein
LLIASDECQLNREFPGWGTVESIEDPNHKGIMSQDFYSKPVAMKEIKPEIISIVADEETGCCKFIKKRGKDAGKNEKLGQWM